jgi:predicted dehydrogenase
VTHLSIGVVGCGHVMRGAYTNQLEALIGRGLVGAVTLCDVDRRAALQAAEQLPGAEVVGHHADLLSRDDVDAVVVLTSMAEHGPIARDALLAGKHVLVEKPMAVTLQQAAELVRLASQSPALLVCAPSVILSPTYRAMWRHLRDGAIGTPALARARYGWSGPDWGRWFYESAGGPLFDLGVYSITSLTGLLGPARGVLALSGIVTPERLVDGAIVPVETPDNYQITIDFGGNVFAVVTTGFSMQKYRSPSFEVYGSEGTLQMLGDDWAPDGFELWQNRVGAWKVFDNTSRNWPWTDGLRHLVECVQDGTKPLITPEHAYHVLEIMVRAMEAARSRSYVPVESEFVLPDLGDLAPAPAPHRVHDRTNV